MHPTESGTGRKAGGHTSARVRRRQATLVPYRVMDDCENLPEGPTPLMRCEATERVSAISAGLNDAAEPLRRFLDEHGQRAGCECAFCLECPHTKDILFATLETLEIHMWLLDNARPPTAAELEELQQIDAAYRERHRTDTPAVVEVR